LKTAGRRSTSPADLLPANLDRNLDCMTFLGTFFFAIGLSDSFPEMTTKFGMLVALLSLGY
jgi:hypothetical protein